MTSTTYPEMRDAAYAANLHGWGGAVGGYLLAPDDYHTWSRSDWHQFGGQYKLPIFVGGLGGSPDGWQCLRELWALGVPPGKTVALDLETRVDVSYVNNFNSIVGYY